MRRLSLQRCGDNPAVPRTATTPPPTPYWLYLLECEDGVYYAGIALDVEQRFFQHVFGRGAKFTRARPPVRVLAARAYASKGEALRAELQLKALPRAGKLAFFDAKP
jgi:putative endonuclease